MTKTYLKDNQCHIYCTYSIDLVQGRERLHFCIKLWEGLSGSCACNKTAGFWKYNIIIKKYLKDIAFTKKIVPSESLHIIESIYLLA